MNVFYKRVISIAMMAVFVIGLTTCKKEKIEVPTVKVFEGAITIDYTKASVSAEVTDQGGAEVKSRGFAYGATGSTMDTIFCGSGTGVYSAELNNLEPNTTYVYEAFAKNAGGFGTSGKVTFNTKNTTAPKVETGEVTDITTHSASCSGNIIDAGGATSLIRGLCWSTNHNPTTDSNHTISAEGTGEFTFSMLGLLANTTYYVRAYAINSKGTGYGSEVSFTTKALQAYTIDVSANPSHGGTVTGGGTFDEGQFCTVKATDNTGYSFVNWTENDEQVSAEREYTFEVMGDRNLVANFTGQPCTITVTVEPVGSGTVTSNGGNHYGDTCTLTATANPGYGFEKWTENGIEISTDAVYSFTLNGNRNLIAQFRVMAFNLDVSADPSVIAKGGSSQLNAVASNGNGSFTYRWTPATSLSNATIQNPTASPTETTTYTCAATSAAGLTESATCTVTVVCPPTNLTATVQNTNQVRLAWTAPNPVTSYKVYRNNILIASNVTTTTYTDSNLASGEYGYQVAAVYQGVESPKSNEAPATIYGSLSVTATASPNTIPFGSSSTLNANATGGNGSYTYSWTPTTGLNNASIQSPTATPTTTTTYTVTVGSNGQMATANVTVNVVKAPTGLSATVQNNNNVHLTWTAANPATNYRVYKNNTLIAQNVTSTTYTDSNLGTGTYSYQVSSVYQGVESPKSSSVQVTIYPSLSVTATANPSTIPQGNSSTLNANATGGNGSYTYSWSPTTGLNNANIQSPTATPTSTTTYTVHVSSNGQTATANVTVNVVKPPTNLTATVQNLNNVYLTWTVANPATSYKVYRDNTLIQSNVTTTHYTDSNLGAGTYSYQVSAVYQGVESPKSNMVQATISAPPTGVINGVFSVEPTTYVYFSQGNLQYKASTGTWRFATNQYDVIGSGNSNISSSYSGWIDLFGWGTSGWNCGNTYYRPWDSNNSNGSLYGPPGNYNLMGSYANSDWGYYNAISNGGNQTHQWRTLTQSEWNYVFNQRNTTSGKRYAKAQVNGVNGVILLPDDWSTSFYSLSSYNSSGASYTSNVISSSNWTNYLEAHGAVFLPAAGYRNGTSVNDVGSYGFYWSASYSSSGYAYNVYFYDGGLNTSGASSRYYGQSVRLVCPAE